MIFGRRVKCVINLTPENYVMYKKWIGIEFEKEGKKGKKGLKKE